MGTASPRALAISDISAMPPGERPKIKICFSVWLKLTSNKATLIDSTKASKLNISVIPINFLFFLKKLNGNLLPNDQPIQT